MINGNGKPTERKPPLWANIIGFTTGVLMIIAGFSIGVLVVAAMAKAAWNYLAKGSL